MPKQPHYIPKLPETVTVSYFDETEWNKDLTPKEVEQQQIIADWQNQLETNERGYGPYLIVKPTAHTTYAGREYVVNDFFIILESEWGVDGQWFFGIPTYRSPKRFIDWHNDEAKRFLERITLDTYDMSGISQNRLMRWRIILNNSLDAESLLRHFASGSLSVRGRGERHHTGAENLVINTVRTALEVYRNGGEVFLVGREF